MFVHMHTNALVHTYPYTLTPSLTTLTHPSHAHSYCIDYGSYYSSWIRESCQASWKWRRPSHMQQMSYWGWSLYLEVKSQMSEYYTDILEPLISSSTLLGVVYVQSLPRHSYNGLCQDNPSKNSLSLLEGCIVSISKYPLLEVAIVDGALPSAGICLGVRGWSIQLSYHSHTHSVLTVSGGDERKINCHCLMHTLVAWLFQVI